ncbi:hypothetical protein QX227_22985 [Pectobacterium aroidearum]
MKPEMSTAVMIERLRALVPESQDGALLNQVANRIELLLAAESGMSREMACIRHALDIPPDQSVQSGVVNAFVRLNGETLGLRSRLEAYDRAAKEPVVVNDDMALAFFRALTDETASSDDVDECKIGLRAAFANISPPLPVVPEGLHPDTAKLVVDFATALAEKLYKSQMKYGYEADWKLDGWPSQCQAHFHQHIAKGDPCDVAAYCAFMWYHGWKTEAQVLPVVPDEINVLRAAKLVLELGILDSGTPTVAMAAWNACRAAILQPANPVWSGIDWAKGCEPTKSVPEGWALVPIDATRKMIDAAIAVDEDGYDAMHKAMIAAAPQLERKDGDA